jgi:heptosyltransferase-2
MSVDRILLVSLDNLGDLVFASALAPPLREHFPSASLDVWCKQYTADIANLIPGVGSVIASDPFWDRAPARRKGSLRGFMATLRRIRHAAYDVAILAAAPWRTAAAVAATGIPSRIGLRRRKNRVFLTHPLSAEDSRRPVMAELARLLPPLGIPELVLRYQLDPEALGEQRTRIANAVGQPFAALHPFASKENRCVALPVWIELANRLVERGLRVLWIGESRELDQLRSKTSDRNSFYIDRTGTGTLAESAAALSLATLFVGHDSGPLHVAGAFGVPVVGIFAPGEPLRTFPQGVGPSRMLARPSPSGISAADIEAEVDALPRLTTAPLRPR